MTPQLRLPDGRTMQHRHLYPLLGFKPGSHIPQDYSGWRVIEGTIVVIHTREHADRLGNHLHRIYAQCAECHHFFPFGRLAQHKGSKRCERLRRKA